MLSSYKEKESFPVSVYFRAGTMKSNRYRGPFWGRLIGGKRQGLAPIYSAAEALPLDFLLFSRYLTFKKIEGA